VTPRVRFSVNLRKARRAIGISQQELGAMGMSWNVDKQRFEFKP
jgi:hypothetical protein